MREQLKQPQPLDLTKSRIETTDLLTAAYYRAAFYEVKARKEDGKQIYTIDVDAIVKKFSTEQIDSRQWILMNFIEFYNGFLELEQLLELQGQEKGGLS